MEKEREIEQHLHFSRVAIIGTGLLGASLGLALKKEGLASHVVGIGRRQSSIDRAMSLGCVDSATTDYDIGLKDVDLIVAATPLGAIRSTFEAIAGAGASVFDRTSVLVTDVGSTKGSVGVFADEVLKPEGITFVGSHPMAGGEKQGPEHARADLFQQAPCVVIEPEIADDQQQDGITRLRDLWQALGCQVHLMDEKSHDAIVARISHLPHIYAAALVNLAHRHKDWHVASRGFRDTTRLASGGAEIWRDILMQNGTPITHAIDEMIQELNDLKALLAAGDETDIYGWLKESQQLRDAWMTKKQKVNP